jgi:membrane associated rhomboid family serine protease
MIFPIGDDNPTMRTPIMTYLLLAAMFASWILVQGAGFNAFQLAASVCNLGLVPGELTHLAPVGQAVPLSRELNLVCEVDRSSINVWTPLTSMFLHGGWGHILGNALFFWVFGNNIEDSTGRFRFLAFYLLCGVAAAVVHVLTDPASPVPTVGASGAISGILGAYLVLYPRVRVRMFVVFLILRLPAWLVLIWWFGMQVLSASLPFFNELRPEVSSGVAVWAHIGGFLTGVLLVRMFEDRRLVARRDAVRRATVAL